MTLKNLSDNLRNKLTKDGLDQFKDGIDYIKMINHLKNLLEKYDEKTDLELLEKYLNRIIRKIFK